MQTTASNPLIEQEAQRVEGILKAWGRVRTPTHKLKIFARTWAEGERRANRLAKAAGITEPTAARWRSRVMDADAGVSETLPPPAAPGERQEPGKEHEVVLRDRLEQLLSKALLEASDAGRLSEFATLAEKMAKLQGWNAPDRVQTESVQVVLQLTGGLDKVDALLVEQFQRMREAGTLPAELAKLQPAPEPAHFAKAHGRLPGGKEKAPAVTGADLSPDAGEG